jgi:hypothetical protein
MFDEITKLLDIKENENLRDIMLPLVKKIYHLPASAHLSCMMKQFMIYEPVSIAVHGLFTLFKHHYESIVEKFIIARNKYLSINDISNAQTNDWNTLLQEWNDANEKYALESSSVILLFINPPKHIKSNIHYKVPGMEDQIQKLKLAIKQFNYPGFCPKAPYQRLLKLLTFPINEFVNCIKALDATVHFPKYNIIEKQMATLLSIDTKKPDIPDNIKRESPPKELVAASKKEGHDAIPSILEIQNIKPSAKLQLIQWYVTQILSLRKQLLPYGKLYEEYFIDIAKKINKVTELIKDEFEKV